MRPIHQCRGRPRLHRHHGAVALPWRTWAYGRHLVPAVFRPFAEDLAARAAALRPRRILELAAGTGVLTSSLLAAAPSAEVTAGFTVEEMTVRLGVGPVAARMTAYVFRAAA